MIRFSIDAMNGEKFDIETRIGSFLKIDEQVGEITYNGNNDTTIIEAISFLNKIYTLMDDKPFYMINNIIHDLGSFPADVWEFIGTDIKHNNSIIGSVVVTKSIGYELQIKFFFKKYPPKYLTKIVSTKKEAYEWVNGLRQ